MFTGLIEATGKILSLTSNDSTTRIAVSGPSGIVKRLRTGDSVAVSGVCLTALDINIEASVFHADLGAATLARTSLSLLSAGSLVNLELPTPAGTPLGGHIVQGHVDGVGRLQALEQTSATASTGVTDWWLRFTVPEGCVRYIAEKGSIAVEGISLTISQLEGETVTVNIIPHTYTATNLHKLAVGSPLNIEVDVLAKYAEGLAATGKQSHPLTLESLISNGY